MNIKDNISGRLANWVSGGRFERAVLEADAGQTGQSYFRERLWELESGLLRNSGDGWDAVRIQGEGGDDFTRPALLAMHRLALVMFLKNPLIKRGVKVQSQYVFGQGVSVQIENDDVANQVWNDFWDHEDNRRELTAPTRLAQLERKLQIKGNLFLIFFVDRVYGTSLVSELDVDEIEEVLPDPDNAGKPAYYKRVYTARILNMETGRSTSEERTEFYPDIAYNPANKPKTIGGAPVFWDRPMMHVARERVSKIGIAPSEIFAQLDWATGYTKFLNHRATVAAALSRIVMKFTSATKAGVDKSRKALATSFGKGRMPTDGDEAGNAAHLKEGSNVEAVNVKGATIHPDEGRRMQLMVCAGFGFGETFFGDVSVGTLATATSLDRPTELAMMECQQFWSEVFERIGHFVLRQAASAPANALSRRATIATRNGREFVLTKDADGVYREAKPTVTFPSLLHHDVQAEVAAIEVVAKRVPLKKWVAKKMMAALNENDADDLLAMLPDDQVLTEWPAPPVNALADRLGAIPAEDRQTK